MLENFGFKGEALRLAWHVAQPEDPRYFPDGLITPRQKSLNRLTEEVYKQQLLPGEKMDVMCKVFIDALLDSLQWNSLGFCTLTEHRGTKRLSLRGLCRGVMVDAAVRSMFGKHLHEIEPDIVRHMMEFNDHVWMIFFRYPQSFCSAVSGPREKMMKALEAFISLPEEERPEQAWSIKKILTAQNIVGIDLQSKASIILMILWA